MLTFRCNTPNTVFLRELLPFQGDLKKRKPTDISALKDSIRDEGMLMPFVVWKRTTGEYLLLDGHGRREALIALSLEDATVLEQPLPVLFVEAETENEARKALLQIVSTYGKINPKGVLSFAAPLQGYKAPVIKTPKQPVVLKTGAPKDDRAVVRLRIPRDRAGEFLELVSQIKWIEVY